MAANNAYEQFFQMSRDLMCIASTDGYFKLVNPAFVDILGYSEEELLSRPFVEFIHPDDRTSTIEEVDTIREGQIPTYKFENRYLKKDGGVITFQWVSSTDNDQGLIYAIARDITDQKNLDQDLKTKDELFNASQTVAKLGNFSYNTVDYSLYWSDELFNIFGITEEEKENLFQAYVDRFDKEGMDLYTKLVNESLVTGEQYAFQHRVHIPNGPVKTVSCIGVPFTDEMGKVFRIDGVVQDITDSVEHEKEIMKSLHEKEFLIKELHHRVKNNLQIVTSLLRLQAELSNNSTVTNHLIESQNRIHSIASVHNLLYLSDNISKIDFSVYIKKLVDDLILSYLGKKDSVDVNFEVDKILLDIDTAVPLGMLMNELITNAFKHAYEGVKDPKLDISINTDGNALDIKVSDNGCGFDRDTIDHNQSLGMMLIDNLCRQVNAECKFDTSNGTSYNVQLDLSPEEVTA